ncbi:MAG TPA: dihydropteroate synthase [Actinomycetota bacterium]|nr:dihydropteroate synthase [Actinomycetota bacterium]
MRERLVWRCRDREIVCGERTLLMGIVNVTPDSFSDGGAFLDSASAVDHGARLAGEGADLLDVGGESTRPGAQEVPTDEELERVVPVIEQLVRQVDVPVGVDTRKSAVASRALEAGASIVNDVTAGGDPEMFAVAREHGAGLVLMHMRGDPQTMQHDPRYDDVVTEVRDYLAARIGSAVASGVPRASLCVDPGVGFGKNLEHNLALLRGIDALSELRTPVLVGVSRKRFIGQLTGVDDPADRSEGTAGAVAWCAARGVDLVRVHDVLQMRRVVSVVDAIARGPS